MNVPVHDWHRLQTEGFARRESRMRRRQIRYNALALLAALLAFAILAGWNYLP